MTERVAIVTGGIRGIGRAVTLALAEAGYKVAAGYAAREEAAKMFTHDTGVPTYKWDVSDFDACAESVAQIEKDLGGTVEVLINNAGITRDGAMHKMAEDQWTCLLYTSPSPRDQRGSRMPSSA